ncbi:hypothetical protein D3C80_2006840 [compost metagenome]
MQKHGWKGQVTERSSLPAALLRPSTVLITQAKNMSVALIKKLLGPEKVARVLRSVKLLSWSW